MKTEVIMWVVSNRDSVKDPGPEWTIKNLTTRANKTAIISPAAGESGVVDTRLGVTAKGLCALQLESTRARISSSRETSPGLTG